MSPGVGTSTQFLTRRRGCPWPERFSEKLSRKTSGWCSVLYSSEQTKRGGAMAVWISGLVMFLAALCPYASLEGQDLCILPLSPQALLTGSICLSELFPAILDRIITGNYSNNGRVFIQSWRRDPPKHSRKILSFSQNDFEKFLSGGYLNRSSGIHRWGLDPSLFFLVF